MNEENEIKRFFEQWAIDFRRKIIYRKSPSLVQKIKEIVIKPKYPVISLYRFARHHEATETGIVYPEIVHSDMLPKISDIPTRFVLNEPWKIEAQDLKCLYFGPLTQGNKILVPTLPKNGFFTTTWNLVGILATIGGAVGFIIWVYNLVINH